LSEDDFFVAGANSPFTSSSMSNSTPLSSSLSSTFDFAALDFAGAFFCFLDDESTVLDSSSLVGAGRFFDTGCFAGAFLIAAAFFGAGAFFVGFAFWSEDSC
jgi:hypothetical protein